MDLRISNRTQNLTTDFVADSLIGNSCRVRLSIDKISREIRFWILCSIGNPNIQILRSKSRFPNRTHPKIYLYFYSARSSMSFNPGLVVVVVVVVLYLNSVKNLQ